MITESNEVDPAAYWQEFVRWLRIQPIVERPTLLQACVQRYGPAPEALRPQIEAALSAIGEAS